VGYARVVEDFEVDWEPPAGERRDGLPRWRVVFLLQSVLLHLLLLYGIATSQLGRPDDGSSPARPQPMQVVVVEPETDPAEEDELEEEQEQPIYEGQIVDISPPPQEERPDDADYLSRYDAKVEEETRTDRFEVNPDVLSRTYSKEQQKEQRELMDVNAERESTGAKIGNQRFDAARDGSMAALPSPWKITNLDGNEDPVPSSQSTANLAGAPQNDLLREAIGEAVNLNSMRYPYAGYMERIRRQVNYWWTQNLDNLPSSVHMSRPSYTTEVKVILNGDGALELVDVTASSGVPELDDAIVRAFRLASPFDNPPAGLVMQDGRVYLPEFDFTVTLHAAQMQYQGIDPRAGVQFPGILKSPR
jgi:outer membrane biosynthesis protein TonB